MIGSGIIASIASLIWIELIFFDIGNATKSQFSSSIQDNQHKRYQMNNKFYRYVNPRMCNVESYEIHTSEIQNIIVANNLNKQNRVENNGTSSISNSSSNLNSANVFQAQTHSVLSRSNNRAVPRQSYLDGIIESEKERLHSENVYFIDDHYGKIMFQNDNLICSSVHSNNKLCNDIFIDSSKYNNMLGISKRNKKSNENMETLILPTINHFNSDGQLQMNKQTMETSYENKREKYIRTELNEATMDPVILQQEKLLKRKLRNQEKRKQIMHLTDHINFWFF